ncbi:hypothetical protein [Streptomyces adelaidensis]|uniref:hypothetical protein n=1 Tax=Streptomyces adelaidensis TaxID=2796465 RepID=UPI001905D9EF|nr:hypothetical protein [Streptomyces adelaidensis]
MRRRARVLSATALIGAALGAAAPAAYAEPAAEVNPNTVEPGGTLTVSVSCDPTGGPAPETIDASSQAFEQGTVKLQRLPGNDDSAGGPSYQGTARIAPAADFETGPDAKGPSEWNVDGTCPAAPGGQGKQWSATFTVSLGGDPHHPTHQPTHQPTHDPTHDPAHDPAHDPTHDPAHDPAHDPTHPTASVQRGVQAGGGGAFTDSVPALVAGGLLIAGALGAAVHRLRRRDRWTP